MLDKSEIEDIYKQNIETDIIKTLALNKGIELRDAMDIYYKSRLSEQIENGAYDIHYLSVGYLVDDLIENEPELFI